MTESSAPALFGLEVDAPIPVQSKLRMLLAYGRDGYYLEPGELTVDNKLDGEGPFRVVPPQKLVGPPDQSVKSEDQDVIWPFDNDADHNAGFATRSATIIRVEPLLEGTTDIDTMEAGWDYIDAGKVVVYGAIDPVQTVKGKISELRSLIREMERSLLTHHMRKQLVLKKLNHINWLLGGGHEKAAFNQISQFTRRFDGCQNFGSADQNDWVTNCDAQHPIYWRLNEIVTLLEITN